MCDNWSYEQLHKAGEKCAIDEMKHAEKLIARSLFPAERPIVSNLNRINIGQDVESRHKSDMASELDAIKHHNDGIKPAVEVGDNGTRELFDSILKDEEDHLDFLEVQLDQLKQMGSRNSLVEQID